MMESTDTKITLSIDLKHVPLETLVAEVDDICRRLAAGGFQLGSEMDAVIHFGGRTITMQEWHTESARALLAARLRLMGKEGLIEP